MCPSRAHSRAPEHEKAWGQRDRPLTAVTLQPGDGWEAAPLRNPPGTLPPGVQPQDSRGDHQRAFQQEPEDRCPGTACVSPLPLHEERAGWPCGLVTANIRVGWPGHRAEPRTRKGGLCSGKPTGREESTRGTALRMDSRPVLVLCPTRFCLHSCYDDHFLSGESGGVTSIEKYL